MKKISRFFASLLIILVVFSIMTTNISAQTFLPVTLIIEDNQGVRQENTEVKVLSENTGVYVFEGLTNKNGEIIIENNLSLDDFYYIFVSETQTHKGNSNEWFYLIKNQAVTKTIVVEKKLLESEKFTSTLNFVDKSGLPAKFQNIEISGNDISPLNFETDRKGQITVTEEDLLKIGETYNLKVNGILLDKNLIIEKSGFSEYEFTVNENSLSNRFELRLDIRDNDNNVLRGFKTSLIEKDALDSPLAEKYINFDGKVTFNEDDGLEIGKTYFIMVHDVLILEEIQFPEESVIEKYITLNEEQVQKLIARIKVVDELGNPVEGANVKLFDIWPGDGSKFLSTTTDENGIAYFDYANGLLLGINYSISINDVVMGYTFRSDVPNIFEHEFKINREKVTITFETNGGSKINPITIFKGSSFTFLGKIPEKENGKFMGWFLDPQFNQKFIYGESSLSRQINESLILYAKWEMTSIEEDNPVKKLNKNPTPKSLEKDNLLPKTGVSSTNYLSGFFVLTGLALILINKRKKERNIQK